MNISNNLNSLDEYLINDYYNINKKFYPYLWTSAYALSVMLKKKKSLKFITTYINKVHNTLGRHSKTKKLLSRNPNKPKWLIQVPKNNILNGYDTLIGGLRIGKAEQERKEGIYLHYITKWVYVLSKTSIKFNSIIMFLQACNIMLSCSEKCRIYQNSNFFTFSRMMEEDMDYPIQRSEIFHDPLDTYLTLYFLYYNIDLFIKKNKQHYDILISYKKIIQQHITDIYNVRIVKYNGDNLVNSDQLGIGFLLTSIGRTLTIYKNTNDQNLLILLNHIIESTFKSLENIKVSDYTTDHKDIYRKCGITIGLRDINLIRIKNLKINDYFKNKISQLKINTKELRKLYHAHFNNDFQIWLNDNFKKSNNFALHKDINIVMYLESKINY